MTLLSLAASVLTALGLFMAPGAGAVTFSNVSAPAKAKLGLSGPSTAVVGQPVVLVLTLNRSSHPRSITTDWADHSPVTRTRIPAAVRPRPLMLVHSFATAGRYVVTVRLANGRSLRHTVAVAKTISSPNDAGGPAGDVPGLVPGDPGPPAGYTGGTDTGDSPAAPLVTGNYGSSAEADSTLGAGWQNTMLSQVNAMRAAVGASPLTLCQKLGMAAQGWSNWQAANTRMAHSAGLGDSFSDRFAAVGYRGSSGGENVAFGFRTVTEVMNAWRSSPGHFSNLVNPSHTQVGFGAAVGPDSAIYFTQDFGSGGNCG